MGALQESAVSRARVDSLVRVHSQWWVIKPKQSVLESYKMCDTERSDLLYTHIALGSMPSTLRGVLPSFALEHWSKASTHLGFMCRDWVLNSESGI